MPRLNLKAHLTHDHILLQMQSPELVIVPFAIQLASAGGQSDGILVITASAWHNATPLYVYFMLHQQQLFTLKTLHQVLTGKWTQLYSASYTLHWQRVTLRSPSRHICQLEPLCRYPAVYFVTACLLMQCVLLLANCAQLYVIPVLEQWLWYESSLHLHTLQFRSERICEGCWKLESLHEWWDYLTIQDLKLSLR